MTKIHRKFEEFQLPQGRETRQHVVTIFLPAKMVDYHRVLSKEKKVKSKHNKQTTKTNEKQTKRTLGQLLAFKRSLSCHHICDEAKEKERDVRRAACTCAI